MCEAQQHQALPIVKYVLVHIIVYLYLQFNKHVSTKEHHTLITVHYSIMKNVRKYKRGLVALKWGLAAFELECIPTFINMTASNKIRFQRGLDVTHSL
jgi:hypothetical protein